MMKKDSYCESPCPIESAMRIIGGKWTASILWQLRDNPMRFNELSRQLRGASKKIITQRLKEMEANKLINRIVISTRPIAVSYKITDFGLTTIEFLSKINQWAEQHNI